MLLHFGALHFTLYLVLVRFSPDLPRPGMGICFLPPSSECEMVIEAGVLPAVGLCSSPAPAAHPTFCAAPEPTSARFGEIPQ